MVEVVSYSHRDPVTLLHYQSDARHNLIPQALGYAAAIHTHRCANVGIIHTSYKAAGGDLYVNRGEPRLNNQS